MLRLTALPGISATLATLAMFAVLATLTTPVPADETAAPVPFGPGEFLTYKVMLGIFDVGESTMKISPVVPTRGVPTYPLEWRIHGGVPFYKVDTRFKSWMDIQRLVSLRFIQDQHEGHYTRFREFQFFPEESRWERADNDEKGALPTPLPLDDLAFIYFVRSLNLEVGKDYRFDRYFQESGNPVIVKVLRRDEFTVPAGTFKTLVVQPIIRTKGFFAEGGEAELHFTDDPRRILVYMRTKMPGISLTLHLKSIRNGTPINDSATTRAELRSGHHN